MRFIPHLAIDQKEMNGFSVSRVLSPRHYVFDNIGLYYRKGKLLELGKAIIAGVNLKDIVNSGLATYPTVNKFKSCLRQAMKKSSCACGKQSFHIGLCLKKTKPKFNRGALVKAYHPSRFWRPLVIAPSFLLASCTSTQHQIIDSASVSYQDKTGTIYTGKSNQTVVTVQ